MSFRQPQEQLNVRNSVLLLGAALRLSIFRGEQALEAENLAMRGKLSPEELRAQVEELQVPPN